MSSMWRSYSLPSIKGNRASSLSIMAAALIAAMFLSLLCSLFYNFWTYECERIVLEEGDWQGRITGALDEQDIAALRSYANVQSAAVNEALSSEHAVVVDIIFRNARTAYTDMPTLTARLGLAEDAAECHTLLLSRYLIHDPQDTSPPLLLAFYLSVLCIVSLALIFIIHNAFAISMQARMRQFGILSSVGATPRQLRACLLQEATALCAVPLLLGGALGVALSFCVVRAANLLAAGMANRHAAVFQYHPLVSAVTLLAAAATVLLSAWLPARKLSKLTPLMAIRDPDGLGLTRKRRARVLSGLFGVEGELAGNALYAQRKALRTSTLSLTLSFLGFTIMLCFLTLSGISTNHTYFEKYQDAWDVMVELPNTRLEDFGLADALGELPGVQSSMAYQKADASIRIPASWQSGELRALGGLSAVAGYSFDETSDAYWAQAPIVIMDDAAFLAYCGQIGVTPALDGAIILNRIWDSVHSSFRYKTYIPYVQENRPSITLLDAARQAAVDIPVLAYARQAPVCREAFENYALTQCISLSVWERISGQIGAAQPNTYVRILAEDRHSLAALDALEANVSQTVTPLYAAITENRLREKVDNDAMIRGFELILGAFCALLAVIGLANVFSNTLGFVRQRKREFARYMSVGMTPKGLRKMLCIEALVIAGRPLLITLPLTAVSVAFMITASHLAPHEFLSQAPILPILAFLSAILVTVGLAYCIGGRRILACDLAEALRNDTM